jgi:predicted enzyme related to lactoylglutathione lyase
MTPDPQKAKSFYKDLFGWQATDNTVDGKTYTMFTHEDKPFGGMFQTPEDKQHIPPHWMGYISVEDIEKTLKKVTSLGGNIIMPKTAAGDMGCFAIIQDPAGAHIALWQAF